MLCHSRRSFARSGYRIIDHHAGIRRGATAAGRAVVKREPGLSAGAKDLPRRHVGSGKRHHQGGRNLDRDTLAGMSGLR